MPSQRPRRVARLGPIFAGVVALSAAAAGSVAAQEASIGEEENLRAEPNGVVISVLFTGTPVEVIQEQGNWLEVAVEGWIWTASTMPWDRGGFSLRVSADGGENLRVRPNGNVLAVMEEGALLQELERVPGWSRVRRQAWIWAPSVDRQAPPAAAELRPPVESTTAPPPAAPPAQGIFRAAGPAPVLGSPNGDTLGVLSAGTEMAVTGRQGNWARVRMEGWVWIPGGQELPGVAEAAAEGALSVDLATVLANPRAYDGRIVTWSLQFVSVESAEAIRTDFYEGEPFLLTRPLSGESARFVYVALPPESLGQAAGLTPLEEITVVGRIRTGASSLTGSPVLDLVELRRAR
ncbi:MAG TPA: SH3 domain-containing protein [Longimicrobiales bacterium]|nr:SH3 domain-containing protein [Longimicrobiales bacterium]